MTPLRRLWRHSRTPSRWRTSRPAHCTGEPTFAALKQAFGNRYIYAGVGTSLPLGPSTGAGERRGEGPALEEDDLITYRKLARREDPFGVRARNLR